MVVAIGPMIDVQLPDWGQKLLPHMRFKAVYGGRAGAKSWTIARLILLEAMEKRLRIVCMREVQKSIAESSRQVLVDTIRDCGLSHWWEIKQDYLRSKSGSLITFQGMNSVTAKNIRSLEGIDRLWFEEAQYMSQLSSEILYPTVRKPKSELWFTFNPMKRTDPVFQDFCTGRHRQDYAISLCVNYDQNPWFSEEMELERQICLRDMPERYEHIWLGHPDDTSDGERLLTYDGLQKCVKAWPLRGKITGPLYAGLDIADTGVNKNAMVARRAGAILHLDSWVSPKLGTTARRVNKYCHENGVARLYYDAGGVGGGIRSYLDDLAPRDYEGAPVRFGDKVAGPRRRYSFHVTNEDHFARRNGQLGWAVRLRMQNTARLLDGEDVPLENCLFINPKLGGLESYLQELTQPVWFERDSDGKIILDKMPDNAPSPDRYDATVLAFALDSQRGLRSD